MPRISDKRRLENEFASAMEEATLAMLLDLDPESEEDFYGLLCTLALAHDVISDSLYLDRRGSAGQLLIEEASVEYLSYGAYRRCNPRSH